MIGALLLAQQLFLTPGPIVTPMQTPLSERGVLATRLDAAVDAAKRLGATLGVVVIDAATGVHVERNADVQLPMAQVQNAAIALDAYERIDRHRLAPDTPIGTDPSAPSARELIARSLQAHDAGATGELLRILGGTSAVNADLRNDGLDGITVAADDGGTAAPRALATFFSKLFSGNVLSSSSRASFLAQLSRVRSDPERFRAGLPRQTYVAHVTGTSASAANDAGLITINGRTVLVVAMLHDARGTAAERDAILADVTRAVDEATKLFPLQ